MGPRLAARVAQQHAALAVRVESERLALSHEAVQRCLGDGILAQRLHGAPQRARAVRGRVPALDDGVREGGRHVERDLHLVGAAALQLRQVELRHLGHFGAGERLEDDHLVQPVEQLRPEAGRHLSPHRAAHGLVAATAAAAPAAPAAPASASAAALWQERKLLSQVYSAPRRDEPVISVSRLGARSAAGGAARRCRKAAPTARTSRGRCVGRLHVAVSVSTSSRARLERAPES
mmetsp:Transcript_32665/g.102661  ORF Transcript_32665/g.102661 Transcript_32665/m.102661 type:complete len:234 (-) Transcript_32665:2-703(-)